MGQFTQAERLARFDSPLGEDVLLLVRFSGEEAVSRQFQFDLELQSERRDIDPAEILGKQAALNWQLRDGSVRHVNGFVSRFSQGTSDAALTSYKAQLVPWTHFLSLRTDNRIFQKKSVLDIATEVFETAGFAGFFEILSSSRPPREFCVQYGESDLNFVQRLLEEEGIFYFFTHEQDKHKLMLADSPSHIPDCPPPTSVAAMAVAAPDEDVVSVFELRNSVRIGAVTYRDYDALQPNFTLDGSVPGQEGEEFYEYWPGRYTTREAGERLAKFRLEAEEALREQGSGRSECRNLVAGHKFTLQDHPNTRANQAYLLTSVNHDCNNGEFRSDSSAVSFDYLNTFTCIPVSVPFRPRRTTPKPLIRGSQTAMVVGPAGEEIFTDEQGRVMVQFHWDRLGNRDENSSRMVRVSHAWAGQGFGAVFIPRVGQEVIVDFLEGDPDQPIIIGRVYNAQQVPPYEVPAHKTQSGVKTRSTPNGSATNFNEIRFEDLKGSEDFFIHAERTMTIKVKASETHSVGGSQSVSVGGNQSVSVGGDHNTKIKKNTNVEVTEGGYNIDVKQKQMFIDVPNAQFHVHGKKIWHIAEEEFTADVHGNTIRMDTSSVTITGKSKVTLTCGGSKIELTPAGITIAATGPVDVKGLPIKLNS